MISLSFTKLFFPESSGEALAVLAPGKRIHYLIILHRRYHHQNCLYPNHWSLFNGLKLKRKKLDFFDTGNGTSILETI
jgi:hypothetical protein